MTAVVAAALAISGGPANDDRADAAADRASAAQVNGTSEAGTGVIPGAVPTVAAPSPQPAPTVVAEPSAAAPVATDAEPVNAGGVVDVVVSWAGWVDGQDVVEVDGYVSGVVEGGGTCTVTLTRGEASLTTTSAAEPDASTTLCAPLFIAGADVLAGTWDAVLSYSSTSSIGVSAPAAVEVPAR